MTGPADFTPGAIAGGRCTTDPIRVAAYSFERPDQAVGYIRVQSVFDRLAPRVELAHAVRFRRLLGHTRKVVDPGLAEGADVVLVQRSFPGPRTRRAMARIAAAGRPVVYETDDDLAGLPAGHPALRHVAVDDVIATMRRADAITVATPALADAARRFNGNVHVLPNLADASLWVPSPAVVNEESCLFAFAGTRTHAGDLRLIDDAVLELKRRHGARVRFRFYGAVSERLAAAGVEVVPFRESYAEHARAICGAGIDVALVPLEDTPFNRGKSDIKWLEFSLAGVPGIFSDVEPYRTVTHGVTGLRVANDTAAWLDAMEQLLADPARRRRIAAAARAEVSATRTVAVGAEKWLEVYRSLA